MTIMYLLKIIGAIILIAIGGLIMIGVIISVLVGNKKQKPGTEPGKVVNVIDGDSLEILNKKGNIIHARLAKIDAPEIGQEFGNESKNKLKRKVNRKKISYKILNTDKYNRKIVEIYYKEIDIGQWMVKTGLAWVCEKFNDDKELRSIGNEVKKARKGLFKNIEAEKPREYRMRIEAEKRH